MDQIVLGLVDDISYSWGPGTIIWCLRSPTRSAQKSILMVKKYSCSRLACFNCTIWHLSFVLMYYWKGIEWDVLTLTRLGLSFDIIQSFVFSKTFDFVVAWIGIVWWSFLIGWCDRTVPRHGTAADQSQTRIHHYPVNTTFDFRTTSLLWIIVVWWWSLVKSDSEWDVFLNSIKLTINTLH